MNILRTLLQRPRKEAGDFLDFLRKKRAYNVDIWNKEQNEAVSSLIADVQALLHDKTLSKAQVAQKLEPLQHKASLWFRAGSEDSWREWTEVFLVAAVIAISFKTYLFQPFKIPTHSMKPTLYGIYIEKQPLDVSPPGRVTQILDFAIRGRSHHRLVAQNSGVIQEIRQVRRLGILPFHDTLIRIGTKSYRLGADFDAFRQGTRGELEPGQSVQAGEVLAHFTTEMGDHLFVNKWIYHFRKPTQGEVFVFTTHSIKGIERLNRAQGVYSGQFYIKRCVGVPGVTLAIKEPYLYSNGTIYEPSDIFRAIYAKKDGYQGFFHGSSYLTQDDHSVIMKKDQYWAMGDNSANSLDSRSWGHVPRQNLVGTGAFVYWPITKRWGFIR
ncbi:MAG: signal peptidase I [Candidatus Methylacidiphilales bacterium]